jgi:transcriptional regulator with XRE-family HTH domain
VTERRPLPDNLTSDIRLLVAELRELKDRAGLSLAALSRRTPYSKSSWERYLNGKALPPQHAVAALGRLSGADPARLTALWELANTAWHVREADGGQVRNAPSDGHAPEVPPGSEPEDPPEPADPTAATAGKRTQAAGRRRFGRRPLIWTAVALAVGAASGAALFGAFGSGSHSGTGAGGDGTPNAGASQRQVDINCFAESCTGKDPAQAGCGDVWTAAKVHADGAWVELRYSDACKAAWSRISWAHPGDIARVVRADGRTYQRAIRYDGDTFSAMVAAASPTTARACALLLSGAYPCTAWGGTEHLTEAPEQPTSPAATAPTAPTAPPNGPPSATGTPTR